MFFGPFVIHDYRDTQRAFDAFIEKQLIGKYFSSQLSILNPYKQLSDWLILLRLLSTVKKHGSGSLDLIADTSKRFFLPNQEFCIIRENGGYEIRARVNSNKYNPGAPITWMLYDHASDCFGKLILAYQSRVSSSTFNTDINRLEKENCQE